MNRNLPYFLSVAFLFALTLIYPGDAPFLNDEGQLILRALNANEARTIPSVGLQGSVGIQYGPVATWIYQILLFITHDLVWVVEIKILLTLAIVFYSFYQIGSLLKLDRRPMLLVLASPFLFFYARLPWDNCFLVPLSSVFLLHFVRFSFQPSRKSLGWLLLMASLMAQVHLMSAMLFIPLLGISLIASRKWIIEQWKSSLISLLLPLSLAIPYLWELAHSTPSSSHGRIDVGGALLGSLFGFRFFAYPGFFEYFYPQLSLKSPSALNWVVGIGILVSTLGSLLFYPMLIESFRSRKINLVWGRITTGLLGVMITSGFLYLVMRIGHHPHYLNATWGIYFLMLWKAYDHRLKAGRTLLFNLHLGSLVILLGLFVFTVHRNGGDRVGHYGATLANQIAVASSLSGKQISSSVYNRQCCPSASKALAKLYAPNPPPNERPEFQSIEYLFPDQLETGWITTHVSR